MSDEMHYLPEPPDGRWQEETTREEWDYWQEAVEDALSERWNQRQTELERNRDENRQHEAE